MKKKRRIAIQLLALATSCLLPLCLPAMAADSRTAAAPGPPDLTSMSLEDLMNVEVVTAASRYDQKTGDAPSSVSIITSSDIRRFGWQNLADILAAVRGFYSTYDRNYTYSGVRGFLRGGDYNTRILLLVDGHRLNEILYGSGFVGDEQSFDVELIERVEVIRGPSSSLYGTSAFLGVVNIVTKKADAEPGTRVEMGVGSFSTRRVRLAHSGSAGAANYSVSGSWYDTPGHKLFFEEFDDPSTQNGVADNDGDGYKRMFGKLEYKDLTVEAAWSSRGKEIPTASFGTIFGDPREKTRDDRALLEVKLDHLLPGGARLLTRAYYDRYYYTGDYPYDYPPVTIYRDPSTADWAGTEMLVTLKPHRRNTITFGGEYRWNIRQKLLAYDTSPYFQYTDVTQSSSEFGVYVADDLTVNPKLSISMGARYDRYQQLGDTVNPRLGVILHPSTGTSLKLLFGTAFRAPNAYERLYVSSNYKTDPDLKSERIETSEIAFEKYFGTRFRVASSVFRFLATDLVSLTVDPSDGKFVFLNAGKARSQGAEVELERRWRTSSFLRFSHAWTTSRDVTTGRRLTASPRNLSKLHLGLPLVGERLAAGLEVLFTSRMLTPTGIVTPGRTVANLTLVANELAPGIDLTAGVYNLLDTKYGDPGSEEHVQDVIPQEGRTVRMGLLWRF